MTPSDALSRKTKNDEAPAERVGSRVVAGHESGDPFPDNAEVGGSIPPSPTGKTPGQTRMSPWRGASVGDEIGVCRPGERRSPLGAVGEPEGQTGVGGLQAPWIVASSTSVRVFLIATRPPGAARQLSALKGGGLMWK